MSNDNLDKNILNESDSNIESQNLNSNKTNIEQTNNVDSINFVTMDDNKEEKRVLDNDESINYTPNNNRIDNIYASDNNKNFGNTNSSKATDSTDNSINIDQNQKAKKIKVKKHKEHRILSTIALTLVVALISGATGGFIVNYMNTNSKTIQSPANPNYQSISIDLNNNPYYAAAVYEKNKDTVVGISTVLVQTYQSFFGGRQQQEMQSIGSGVIINSNGLILTNSHVIGDGQAKSVDVTLFDGSIEKAEVLWYDAVLDLAVVKISKTNLPYATIGDSDNVLIGEPVVAMGNPMSLELYGTTTDGIISGLNRSITIEGNVIKPLIQTSASINPGNSGGPLFNAKGEVIGINTAKLSNAEGIGFSIPINVATPIINQITNNGKVTNVYFGIVGTSVYNYEKQLGIKLSTDYGFYVSEVSKNSPMKKAGIRAGDIIIAVDDTEIKNIDDLRRVLYNYSVGDKATITYTRDGEKSTTEVTFEKMPDNN
ncbi:trypsin-like peptidase domain-containing protein [Sedimentibacter sp. zth1]|uniref:S1C family serine protease n=1 Tax=Sedimentibacter sp. zth1 TaxID=2816908 RepID=UPI001A912543|nr:trypsin-like peptidase domain-containing protein [Sedimentibacter sp. zth1]QSX05013.1 trypsin-like peptidase domain-containing protein [Sedimentibacter sp. zth1]